MKRKQLLKKLISAFSGMIRWRKILGSCHNREEQAYILLPEENGRAAYYALIYLEQFLTFHKKSGAVIISQDDRAEKYCRAASLENITLINSDEKTVCSLLDYYSLIAFDSRFTVASFEKPDGRCGSRLVGFSDMSEEQIFLCGIYRIYPYKILDEDDRRRRLADGIFNK